MTINHGGAIALEMMVREVWGLHDRAHLHGRIDADHFEYDPYDAAIYILAPYVMHDSSVDRDPFVHSTLEDLYCLCCADEYSKESESQIMQKTEALLTYLSQHYTPAK